MYEKIKGGGAWRPHVEVNEFKKGSSKERTVPCREGDNTGLVTHDGLCNSDFGSIRARFFDNHFWRNNLELEVVPVCARLELINSNDWKIRIKEGIFPLLVQSKGGGPALGFVHGRKIKGYRQASGVWWAVAVPAVLVAAAWFRIFCVLFVPVDEVSVTRCVCFRFRYLLKEMCCIVSAVFGTANGVPLDWLASFSENQLVSPLCSLPSLTAHTTLIPPFCSSGLLGSYNLASLTFL
jgi:hypothetical protein